MPALYFKYSYRLDKGGFKSVAFQYHSLEQAVSSLQQLLQRKGQSWTNIYIVVRDDSEQEDLYDVADNGSMQLLSHARFEVGSESQSKSIEVEMQGRMCKTWKLNSFPLLGTRACL